MIKKTKSKTKSPVRRTVSPTTRAKEWNKSETARKEDNILEKEVEVARKEFDEIHTDFVVAFALVDSAFRVKNDRWFYITPSNKARFDAIDTKSLALMGTINTRKSQLSKLCGIKAKKYEDDLPRKTAKMINDGATSTAIRKMQDELGETFYGVYIENKQKVIALYKKYGEEFKKMTEVLRKMEK